MYKDRACFVSALLLLMSAGCSPAERSETGEIETAGSVDAFTIRVGDCFDDQFTFGDEVSDVPGVPCTDPHDNEVYAKFDLQVSEWPGDDRANELADEGCLDRFERAIGARFDDSILQITTMIPTAGSWAERGDREVVCIAYHMELDKLTGTVLNSGR